MKRRNFLNTKLLGSLGLNGRQEILGRFNMVPGAEAVPIIIDFPSQSSEEVSCTIKVI